MKKQMLFIMSMLIIFSGCVPMRGDYSEFSSRTVVSGAVLYTTKPVTFAQGTYQGGLLRGYPHEKGTFKFWNGTVYEGEFRNGKFHGKGRMTMADSSVVEGSFVEDRENIVTLTRKDGAVFSGPVYRGKPAGQGVLMRADRTSIVGNITAGGVTGTGLLLDAQGMPSYAGPFKGEKPHGEGICNGRMCIKENGVDATERTLSQLADSAAEKRISSDFDSERNRVNEQFERTQQELTNEREQLELYKGPTKESDRKCYCSIAHNSEFSFSCTFILVRDSDKPYDYEADRLAEERNRLEDKRVSIECRTKYAKWLGLRETPDYSAELKRINSQIGEIESRMASKEAEKRAQEAEIERRRKQTLADQAEKRRVAQQELERIKAEKDRKLKEEKEKCRDEKYRRGHPCGCAGLLNQPLTKGGACEA